MWNDMEEKTPLEKLYEAERIYKKQKQEAEDVNYIFKLSENNLCKAIKTCITVYDYAISIIEKAVNELNITDKRRKKDNLIWLEHSISDEFFDEKVQIKINKIVWYGYNKEAAMVHFAIDGITYYIEIPLRNNLGYEFDSYYYGRFKLVKEKSESYYEVLVSSYDIKDIKDYILKNII